MAVEITIKFAGDDNTIQAFVLRPGETLSLGKDHGDMVIYLTGEEAEAYRLLLKSRQQSVCDGYVITGVPPRITLEKFKVIRDEDGGLTFPDFPNGLALGHGETLRICGDEAWIEPAGTESARLVVGDEHYDERAHEGL